MEEKFNSVCKTMEEFGEKPLPKSEIGDGFAKRIAEKNSHKHQLNDEKKGKSHFEKQLEVCAANIEDVTTDYDYSEPVVTIVDVDCEGNATLQGNELGNGLTGYWKKASDSYAGEFADGSINTAATQYLGIPTGATVGLTWTLTNEVFDNEAADGKFTCTADKTVYVTNGGFGVTAGPNDITDCSDTYQLQGSLPDGAHALWTALFTLRPIPRSTPTARTTRMLS